ncbi:SGNH/GDSL hydrolase family protein [Streptomyces cavernae]|uniref:SGNH/GDSL hydrolase family protein n=1 Tax=Streptomyces cavernae TaxID=2259034 RepID=UPI000FEB720B|nr:SGNH/GDSL hydrolase family protein [Streptomyces cavernae]
MRKLTSAVVAAVMAFAGMGAAASAPAQAATGAEYVALGDSYASGVGSAPYDPSSGACLRSPNSYPRQYAATHPTYTLKDVTCSGATIADVRNNQLSALSEKTSLVTLTVGGNDAQFAPVVELCLTKNDSACASATAYMSDYAKNRLMTQLTELYKDIKARAPRALVLVLGYPRTLSSTGSCGAIDLSAAKRTAMNGMADALAEGARAASVAASVYFIDMRQQFSGHEACGSDPWINGVNLADPTSIFHPNTAGHTKGYAAKLSSVWG